MSNPKLNRNLMNMQIPGNVVATTTPSEDKDNGIELVKIDFTESNLARTREIELKITTLTAKIDTLTLNEGRIKRMINENSTEIENLSGAEFTRRGQKQSILLKQLEALSLINDTMLKYEDTIYKYQKILVDLQNNKFNNLLRIETLKREESTQDDSVMGVLMDLQKKMNPGHSSGAGVGDEYSLPNTLLIDIENELRDGNYKV